jgi:CBS domain-containing protein
VNAATDRLTVADAMHHGLVTCDVDTPLSKVAQMMAGHRIHCVVVHSGEDQGTHFWCVVSDLDLAASLRVFRRPLTSGRPRRSRAR